MKIISAILLVNLFLFAGCHRQQNEGELYQLTPQDSLNFLVTNSDLIAIVEIFDGSESGPGSKREFHEKVTATIHKLILGQDPEQKTITIQYEPFNKPDTSSKVFMFLYNGVHLAFLKNVGENNYKPTTGNSLSSIFGADRVYPIWKQGMRNETKDTFSDGYKLSEIIEEIKKEQNKKNLTSHST